MESERDILADEVITVMDDNSYVRETVGPSSSKRKKKGAATTEQRMILRGKPASHFDQEINTVFCASSQ